ncbi:MAG: LCP family protein [Clostridiales bacterium]|nr:LCP family protein [Clostridiales bacterium]
MSKRIILRVSINIKILYLFVRFRQGGVSIKRLALLIILLIVLFILFLGYIVIKDSYLTYVTDDVPSDYDSETLVLDLVENPVEDTSVKQPASDAKNSYSFMIFGLDTREEDYSGRSDVMMYVTLDHYHKEMKIVSFMRDLRVSIIDHGQTKLGHAYAYGKERVAIETFENNFDLEIDEYITLNFVNLKDIVDVLGGVTVTVKENEARNLDGINSGGEYLLNGEQVLAYVRTRNVGNGDFERTKRQRTVLETIMNSLSTLSNEELIFTIGEVYPLLETSFDIDEIYEEISKYRVQNERYEISTLLIPTTGSFSEKMIDGIYYLVINDLETLKNELKFFLKGE